MIGFLLFVYIIYLTIVYISSLNWEQGRQEETKYKKLCIYSFKFLRCGWDCYILKYAPYTSLDPHFDKVNNGKHYKMNITLKGNGYFSILEDNNHYFTTNDRINIFRPDIEKHSFLSCKEGCTKLSLGFVKFNKKKEK